MERKNVYQTPENPTHDTSKMSDDALRAYYLQDEVCVQVVAWLYLFFGSFLLVLALVLLKPSIEYHSIFFLFMAFTTIIISLTLILLGWGMRHYDTWACIPARFAAIVIMFFVPLGTLIGLASFFLLKHKVDKDVFTHKYRTILLSDPFSTKYKNVWLPLGIGSLTAILMLLAILFQRQFVIDILSIGFG